MKRVEEKESYSTRAFHVATRADVIALQEATGSTLGAVGSAVGGDRKLEPDAKGTVVGLKIDGGNEHKTLHTGKRKRQKMEDLA